LQVDWRTVTWFRSLKAEDIDRKVHCEESDAHIHTHTHTPCTHTSSWLKDESMHDQLRKYPRKQTNVRSNSSKFVPQRAREQVKALNVHLKKLEQ
jgi:hypothetical protein